MPGENELDCSNDVQAIRLVDVFVLGPAMVWVGAKAGTSIGGFVAVLGAGTLVRNGMRYLEGRRLRKA